MATIKVKFRQFAESEQGGSVYYRIYHRNQIRQIASGYTMQGDEWQSRNGSKSEKFPPSKPETEIPPIRRKRTMIAPITSRL